MSQLLSSFYLEEAASASGILDRIIMSTRRQCLQSLASLGAFAVSSGLGSAASKPQQFVSKRPPASKRGFVSSSVEKKIAEVKASIADPELAWIFENCFPNTLDTTVRTSTVNGKPDTFVITGDIDAMWLRDSSAQVWPYLPLAKNDAALRRMLEGVIRRQAACILIDPYANAFVPSVTSPPLSWSVRDSTDLKPGVGERKWEIDSLCYPIRLAYGYWTATGDTSPFDERWHAAMRAIVRTFHEQQRKTDRGPYHFQRAAESATDTLPLGGYGNPARPIGLLHSMFRPSDDACIYPLFIPANLFAITSLHQLADMAAPVLHDAGFASDCIALANEIATALEKFATIQHPEHGDIWAYEVDGFGNQLFMDDANAPGLLSLPYLGCCSKSNERYLRTRKAVLSSTNPYYFVGKAGRGIGGPHEGLNQIWPMSITFQALTSSDSTEIKECLRVLTSTHAGTGFMHETFDKDNPSKFTRPWFAWANTLFGELIVTLHQTNPELLSQA